MKHILVVDDNKDNCELLTDILSESAKVTVAFNGEEALAVYEKYADKKTKIDLILLDIAMPGIDGIEVLNRIRADESKRGIDLGQGIPIIMVTAYKEPFLGAFNGGCDDYILKPLNHDELIRKIEEKIGVLN